MAWRAQARFLTCAGGSSGLISHLDLAWRRTSTSDWKDFPTTLPSGQGNSMAWRAQGHRFSTCVGVIFNVKRRVQNL